MSEFMLMLRGSFKEWRAKDPKDREQIMEKYGKWVEDLHGQGLFVGGSELTGVSKLLFDKDGSISIEDGPYAETKECLTGYFIIKAKNIDEATQIARGCPALTHGETVEVMPHGNCEVDN